MRHKRPVLVVLTVALLASVAGIIMAAMPIVESASTTRWRVFAEDQYLAENKEGSDLTAEGITGLIVDGEVGTISITSGPENRIIFKVHKKVWAPSVWQAQEDLKSATLSIERQAEKIVARVLQTPKAVLMGTSRADTVDLTIVVPKNIDVTITNQGGGITLAGISGDVNLLTRGGPIFIADVVGSVVANTGGGEIRAQRIDATDDILKLTSRYGHVRCEASSGENIQIEAGNGEITLNELKATNQVAAQNRAGSITLNNVTAKDYQLNAPRGDVIINGVKSPKVVNQAIDDIKVELSGVESQAVEVEK